VTSPPLGMMRAKGEMSASASATLLPDLRDLSVELVKEVIWCARQHLIANQVKRRPL
jgi:hypothetical protein